MRVHNSHGAEAGPAPMEAPVLVPLHGSMTSTQSHDRPAPRIAIIGSGFAGLGAAIALQRAGYDDVSILERADGIGGVWRDNDYPGAACDVQSYLYSFSFAPHHGWTRMFSPQDEILDYLHRVAEDFGLLPKIRLGCAVEDVTWDADRSVWVLTTAEGVQVADHVVLATGALADPAVPDLAGVEDFTGAVFHSSRWDHGVDLTGKRVAVVGTGASAIQFVPAIQPEVEQLTLFQRTPPWVMPRHDRPIRGLEKAALGLLPPLQTLRRARIWAQRELTVLGFRHPGLMKGAERTARKHLAEQVSDPALREKLTPAYRLGCKRILISNTYLRALDAPNADVVTSGIERVTATGVVDGDGVHHEVDAIIFGTGFKTDGLPLTDRVHGPGGATLAQTWGSSPRAYLGTTVAGFPNLYLMHGPNIGLGHTSVITMFEAQARYVVDAVSHSVQQGAPVEPTPEAQQQFVDLVDDLTDGTVWTSGGCSSWYLDSTGRNSNLWPGATIDYHRRTLRFRSDDHRPTTQPQEARR
ncbi:MAG: putative monooxygenase [Marmoricola sp.]|nr:putative monooxygenase [Marmoricola sp.]